jgi:hypothetical protein
MAGAAYFVVTDRSRLESQIHRRQARYASCAQRYPGHRLALTRADDCGWLRLSDARRGDLLGLPFLAVALGLFLLLIYKIGRPRTDVPLKIADGRAEDPLM